MIRYASHDCIVSNTVTFENGVPTFGNAWNINSDYSSIYNKVAGLVFIEDEYKFKLVFQQVIESSNSTYGLKIYDSSDGITWEANNYDTNIAVEGDDN